MRIIKGFQNAKSVLKRQPSVDFDNLPSRMKAGIKVVFGRELSAEDAVKEMEKHIKR